MRGSTGRVDERVGGGDAGGESLSTQVVDSFGFLSHCGSIGYSVFKKVLQLLWTVDSGHWRAGSPGMLVRPGTAGTVDPVDRQAKRYSQLTSNASIIAAFTSSSNEALS